VKTEYLTPEEVTGWFEGVAADLLETDVKPWLKDETVIIAGIHEYYFAAEIGPDGRRWPRLSPNTHKRVGIEGPDKILVDAGALRESLTVIDATNEAIRDIAQQNDETFLLFGTYVPYSVFHDEDDPLTGRPARRHVGLTDEYLDGATERLLDFVIDAATHE
jgi:hypothetical protein